MDDERDADKPAAKRGDDYKRVREALAVALVAFVIAVETYDSIRQVETFTFDKLAVVLTAVLALLAVNAVQKLTGR